MGLRAKIFFAFFTTVVCLLAATLYFTNTRSEAFEVKRITNHLALIQRVFERRLDLDRAHKFKLVRTITSDPKYRSFLERIRDNFYSFAEEIALDTGADLVLMVDEDQELRGVSPPRDNAIPIDAHRDRLAGLIETPYFEEMFDEILDSGEGVSRVIAFDRGLINGINVPLKESVRDDYALGVVSVGLRIDDAWIGRMLGKNFSEVQAVFHVEGRPVAANLPEGRRGILLNSALAAGESRGFQLDGERYLMLRGAFPKAGLAAGYVLSASLDAALAPFVKLQWQILAMGIAVLTVGLLVMLVLSNRIVHPIRLLVEGTQRVVKGDYSWQSEVRSRDEVGTLTTAFNHMVEGLREKEMIRNLFGKYVHPSIISDFIENPDALQLGGQRRVQTLMFSDVAGFTTISENMDAEHLVGFLNQYLGAMTEELSDCEGIMDKYLGDGIMAFFGPPFAKRNHALQACRAALRMEAKLGELREEWRAQGQPLMYARIGLATGEVIVGNVGSEKSQDFTCIGDIVNLSSRLEGVNKFYGTTIIIEEKTRELAGDAIVTRELDAVRVKGREGGTRIFELVALKGDTTAEQSALIGQYETALAHYRERQFHDAAAIFSALAASDGPSGLFAEECRQRAKSSPPADWQAVRVMTDK